MSPSVDFGVVGEGVGVGWGECVCRLRRGWGGGLCGCVCGYEGIG